MKLRFGRRVTSSDFWKVWGPMALVVVLGFVAALLTLEPAPPKRLRIAAGDRSGAYHAFATRYREILSFRGPSRPGQESPAPLD